MIKSSIKSLSSPGCILRHLFPGFYFDFATLHSISFRHFPLSFEINRYFRFKPCLIMRYKKYHFHFNSLIFGSGIIHICTDPTAGILLRTRFNLSFIPCTERFEWFAESGTKINVFVFDKAGRGTMSFYLRVIYNPHLSSGTIIANAVTHIKKNMRNRGSGKSIPMKTRSLCNGQLRINTIIFQMDRIVTGRRFLFLMGKPRTVPFVRIFFTPGTTFSSR